MANITFQCDEYSETRQEFRDQIGKKPLVELKTVVRTLWCHHRCYCFKKNRHNSTLPRKGPPSLTENESSGLFWQSL